MFHSYNPDTYLKLTLQNLLPSETELQDDQNHKTEVDHTSQSKYLLQNTLLHGHSNIGHFKLIAHWQARNFQRSTECFPWQNVVPLANHKLQDTSLSQLQPCARLAKAKMRTNSQPLKFTHLMTRNFPRTIIKYEAFRATWANLPK